ncbi:ribosomal protein S12 methylthiotransferase accessory factor [Rhizobium lentis]|uniref:Ribosomal protein S12 methylthiotransferase accessory factor n=1 Tax=Rhizobium lentis TaxID=1138194 RepID=A0A7W8XCZ3_9HYPH|nr:ribosomal protein S12 methylthiotransferase accessory factor [Rhizobium lentis]MBB5548807.1 ribosomal protein S12 methylthiotransferase accessory factor [Rhizobium lentis]MBB5559339.1 ribosomal protein S12 methylthiotransferase accessory factor [Rhizobium lentis]MBB5565138.1 ribosomal protein S12 methylthiotransferase accessory factor [Rhizobium lentis]
MTRFGVTRVARHTGLDDIGIPVWCAYTPNSRSIVIAQGKGLTDVDAKVSTVMEALERAVAGEPFVDRLRSSASGLRAMGHKIDTLDCLIAIHKPDLGPDEETDWVAGIDILTGGTIYIPFEAVVLDRTRDARYWMSSDGLASGNNLEEAIFHGLLERIERDAHVLWQVSTEADRYAGCVDPRGFLDGALDGLIDKIDASGLALRLFDITSDITIPCFTAMLGPGDCVPDPRDRHGGRDIRLVEVTGGTGAHPSPVRAAIRAITEAVQSRLTYISGARDDISPATFSRSLPPLMRRAFDAVPGSPGPTPQHRPRNLTQMLQHVLEALRTKGIGSVIAIRLSEGTLPFSVVKVVIPALESPEGERARRLGTRALARAIGF